MDENAGSTPVLCTIKLLNLYQIPNDSLAEATRLQQQVLTPLFVQKLWIDSWNGVLPTTITGSNTSFLMGVPK